MEAPLKDRVDTLHPLVSAYMIQEAERIFFPCGICAGMRYLVPRGSDRPWALLPRGASHFKNLRFNLAVFLLFT